ncbi:hypothetical protein CEXT_61531 [Caerostris extrusa]|uniref:Uncharacterized protein n=1 Tax=Caerostris extrusa TaxID=172846 RepID=A0AAV4RKY1_CAEEX|nr:hypothetical protein CEXT_61531 [Caerostris extrusa]
MVGCLHSVKAFDHGAGVCCKFFVCSFTTTKCGHRCSLKESAFNKAVVISYSKSAPCAEFPLRVAANFGKLLKASFERNHAY